MINVKFLPEDKTLDIEFEGQNITEPTTDRSLKNIKKTLIYSLRREYSIEDIDKLNDIADKILKIHGLHKDNFDFVKQAGISIKENINDFSIDDNSNKSDKNPKSIIYEVTAPIHKLIGYDYLYQIMRELYSKKEAKRLSGLMYDYTLALADTTNVLIPYCWSFDATRVITEGKRFGQLESSSSHRIASYIAILNEVIHTMSNNLAGALAIGTFFLDLAHLGIYKDKISLTQLKSDKDIQGMLENQFQQVVHGFNSLSRNGGTESPFTNISLLDRTKLATVLDDDNGYYDMLFTENKQAPVFQGTGIDIKDRAAWKAYVIEYIIELQNIYMKFFDKGDPLTDGMPYRFPVCFPGEESIIINNNIVSFEEEFGDYLEGWTDVKNLNLSTEYLDKEVKINAVYVGESKEFIELEGYGIGKKIKVTPDHKFFVEDKGLVCAKDLSLKDRLLWHKFNQVDSSVDILDVEEILSNLWTLGYKLKYSDTTKKLVVNDEGVFKSNSLDSYNHNKSHPSYLIQKCQEDIFEFPEVIYVKTEKSKQRGAIRKKIDLNFDFGFLCGLFYAEGHSTKGEIGFSFHEKEQDLISFVNDYINYIVKDVIIRNQYSKDNKGMQTVFNSETLTLLLNYIIKGDKAQNKYLNIEFLNKYSNRQFYEGILLGCIAGDGHVNKYSCSQTTISKKGAESIQYLSRKIGVATVIKDVEESICEFNGKSYLSKHQYEIDFCKKDIIDIMDKYNNYCDKFSVFVRGKKDLNNRTSFIIRKIEKSSLNSPIKVFNIEVNNNEHLFTLPCGVITSNCTLNLGKSFIEDKGWVIDDKAFLKSVCKKNIYRYNIFVSEGTKFASCCFQGDETINIQDSSGANLETSIKSFVECYEKEGKTDYAVKDGSLIKSMIPKTQEQEVVKIVGALKKLNTHKQLIKIEVDGHVNNVTPDHMFLAKEKKTGNIVEISAEELVKEFNNYLLPIQVENV